MSIVDECAIVGGAISLANTNTNSKVLMPMPVMPIPRFQTLIMVVVLIFIAVRVGFHVLDDVNCSYYPYYDDTLELEMMMSCIC